MASIAALVFILGMWPLIGAWGILTGIPDYCLEVFMDVALAYVQREPDGITFGEGLELVLNGLLSVVLSLTKFFVSIKESFGGAWDWAKYDHPCWGFLLGVFGMSAMYANND